MVPQLQPDISLYSSVPFILFVCGPQAPSKTFSYLVIVLLNIPYASQIATVTAFVLMITSTLNATIKRETVAHLIFYNVVLA